MRRLTSLLIALALLAGTVGCPAAPVEVELEILSTSGGSVTVPGEEKSTHEAGTVVALVAEAEGGYRFLNWTGDVGTIASVNAASTTITMNDNYSISANFIAQHDLTVSSTTGGSVIAPGEGMFTYDAGTVVELVAQAEGDYVFDGWAGEVTGLVDVGATSTSISVDGDYSITATFAIGIYDWYDLDAIRDNLGGSYVLTNNLDSSTAGYEELASSTADEGRGWQPIGVFIGTLDGRGHQIGDLFINRPDVYGVGLFAGVSSVGGVGVIKNVSLVHADVTGYGNVGALVGRNNGTVTNSYSTSSVVGVSWVGGLVGENMNTVSGSSSSGTVIGDRLVGGLVGFNQFGTVTDSCSQGSVIGDGNVGGLVGYNQGTLRTSYFVGTVTGRWIFGGLVGHNNRGTVTNSYYNYDETLINSRHIITIGALSGEDFEEWLANGKFLAVDARLSEADGYYVIDDVSGFKQLLVFGQDSSLRFRLTRDLDLVDETDFYVPYLAGEFDGDGHTITNMTFNYDAASHVGLFGYVGRYASVSGVRVENANITAYHSLGVLAGANEGTIRDSSCSGSIAGSSYVGMLVGYNTGAVIDSYANGGIAAGSATVGGLIGSNPSGTVANSYYNHDEVLVNGDSVITVGALFHGDFDQWLANGKFLDVSERLSQQDGCYLVSSVSDLKQLLAFGQDDSLRFRLTNDLDLGNDRNFYIPYLAGHFDGNGHKISNLSLNSNRVSQVGLFGQVAPSGQVTQVGVDNADISIKGNKVGALVGLNNGAVRNSYSTGSVTGGFYVGGLVGFSDGTVNNCYATGSVIGDQYVGGLVGWSQRTVSNSYSAGSVTGSWNTGGLAGFSYGGFSGSFWDIETSGHSTSAGGVGKTTAQMRSLATFSGAGWNIAAVAPGERNTDCIWNVVEGQTYPFLSWQQVP